MPDVMTKRLPVKELSPALREKFGLQDAPDEAEVEMTLKKVKRHTQEEIERRMEFFNSIKLTREGSGEDSTDVIRELREGRSGRASSSDDE